MTTPRIVFQDASGRILTADDIAGVSGTVNWQVVGGEHVPAQARELHRLGCEAGGRSEYDQAMELFAQAEALAPNWPHPRYDAAFTALLMGDNDKAEEYYSQVDRLAPRGFFTCKSTLALLRRERAGSLFPGFTKAFLQLEWMRDREQKRAVLQGIVAKYPDVPQVWEQLASLLQDPQDKLRAIDNGLAEGPDIDTRGMLLLHKALALSSSGDRPGAVALLGGLALDPDAGLAAEALAKFTLRTLVGGDG